MRFELDDSTVLKLSGLACCAYGLHNYITPEHANSVRYELGTPTSTHTTCMMGLITVGTGSLVLSASGGDDLSVQGRKNLLKAGAATWAAIAAQTLYNTENGVTRKDFGYPNAAAMAVLSGLCLWRGLKEEDTVETIGK